MQIRMDDRKVGFLLLAFILQACQPASESKTTGPGRNSQDRPNIVLIVADDLGYGDISLHGNQLIETMHIDQLAAEGVEFTRSYAASAVCAPSRAALLTGRYPQRIGFEYNLPFPPVFLPYLAADEGAQLAVRLVEKRSSTNGSSVVPGLPTSELTIAELLKFRGYKTGLIGKWHLGYEAKVGPKNQGFDEFVGFVGGASLYAAIDDTEVISARLPWDGADNALWDHLKYNLTGAGETGPNNRYMTEVLADEASRFIENNRDTPFFLYAAFNAPHTPLQAPREYYRKLAHIEDHKTRVYYAMVASLDAAVGRIVDTIDKLGLAENTLIVFTSDNGGAGYTRIPDLNKPFRGGKSTFFEGGVVVPLLMRWKDNVPKGHIVDEPVGLLDLFATFADVAGAPMPGDIEIDSNSLRPFLGKGGTQYKQRDRFWRADGYKAVISNEMKLQYIEGTKKYWLYDLKNDPYEQLNLATHRLDVVESLKEKMDSQEKYSRSPLWPITGHLKVYIDPISGSDMRILNDQESIYWPF